MALVYTVGTLPLPVVAGSRPFPTLPLGNLPPFSPENGTVCFPMLPLAAIVVPLLRWLRCR